MEPPRPNPLTWNAATHSSGETTSTFVARELRSQVASLYICCMNGETIRVPRQPVYIFTEEELDRISNSKQRIFYSYFSLPEARLRVKIDFEPHSEFDYLLVGMYHKRNGLDENLAELLGRRPELFVFTLDGSVGETSNYFAALFTPYLPHDDFGSIDVISDENFPLCLLLDGETHDCLGLAEKLHGSPLLRDVTYHMSTHHSAFTEELVRRRDV